MPQVCRPPCGALPTDVANPVELHSEVIGYAGTDSEVLDDHKALLFSAPKNLMAFPVTVTEKQSNSSCCCKYEFQGACFYYIDEFTFSFEAKKTHYNQGTFPCSCFCPTGKSIRRIIYINGHLYTISEGMIKAFEMGTYEEMDVLELE